MQELTDAQFIDRLRRRYRAEGRFSRAVRSLGWDYKRAYARAVRIGCGPEFGIGLPPVRKTTEVPS